MLVTGIALALICAFSVTAQAQEPAVKVVPGADANTIKVIYGYESQSPVEIRFTDETGTISLDRIKGRSFAHGFVKKYKVTREKGDAFWVQINSQDLAITYKLTAQPNGKWLANLEQTTYNYPAVASR